METNNFNQPQPQKINGLGIVGMIIGIIALLSSVIIIGGLIGVIGFILSVIAITQTNRKKGTAIAGIILNLFAVIVVIFMFIIIIFAPRDESATASTDTSIQEEVVVEEIETAESEDVIDETVEENFAEESTSADVESPAGENITIDDVNENIESINENIDDIWNDPEVKQAREEFEEATFGDSAETVVETKEDFIASCQEISYKTLARNPEDYIGERITLTVRIEQILQGGWFDDNEYYRVYTKGKYDSWYEDEYFMYDFRTDDDMKILEDDIVLIYGEFAGMQTITRAFGNVDEEIPAIKAYYIELISE